jgi:hypothetical protein
MSPEIKVAVGERTVLVADCRAVLPYLENSFAEKVVTY